MRVGSRVVVECGANGGQYAVVFGVHADGRFRVHKWNALRRRWRRALVRPRRVLRFAGPYDRIRYKPQDGFDPHDGHDPTPPNPAPVRP